MLGIDTPFHALNIEYDEGVTRWASTGAPYSFEVEELVIGQMRCHPLDVDGNLTSGEARPVHVVLVCTGAIELVGLGDGARGLPVPIDTRP